MDLRFKERFCPEEGFLEAVEFSFFDLDGYLIEGEFYGISIQFKTERLERNYLDPEVLLQISKKCIQLGRKLDADFNKSWQSKINQE